jgi:hypothetical protein
LKVLKENGMSTSENKFDSLEQLIFDENLRISTIDFHKDHNLMLVVLNTGNVLHEKISNHARLKSATEQKLKNYELIAGGTGVHWPDLDEDLSLKGFLKEMLKNQVSGGNTQYKMSA